MNSDFEKIINQIKKSLKRFTLAEEQEKFCDKILYQAKLNHKIINKNLNMDLKTLLDKFNAKMKMNSNNINHCNDKIDNNCQILNNIQNNSNQYGSEQQNNMGNSVKFIKLFYSILNLMI